MSGKSIETRSEVRATMSIGTPSGGGAIVLILEMAMWAVVFVVVSGLGAALNVVAASLLTTKLVGVIAQILGYGLQLFAAVWFFAVATNAWSLFAKADNAIHAS